MAHKGLIDNAIAAYKVAVRLKPDYAGTHTNLGLALQKKGEIDAAITEYREVIRLKPDYAVGHNLLGLALEAQGNLDGAVACYRKSIALDPNSSLTRNHTRNALANVLGNQAWDLANSPDPKLRDPKRAVDAGTQSVEHAPQSDIAWQKLGWVQYRAGNWKASIEALEKSSKLQDGGMGDYGQWIVMSLAHWKIANQKDLPEQERDRHIELERVWPEQLRRFRAEAEELMGVNVKKP